MSATGLHYDSRILLHVPKSQNHECPERVVAIVDLLDSTGLRGKCTPVVVSEDVSDESLVAPILGLCHAPEYVSLILKNALQSKMDAFIAADLDDDDDDGNLYYCSENEASKNAIVVSCLGVCKMVSSVLPGCHALARGIPDDSADRLLNGACVVRPPGHHAKSDVAMGYCFVNHVAVASHYARRRCGAKRVAIVDFDVHHGNGTRDLVAGDDGILYISLHRDFYPWSGGMGDDCRGNSVHLDFHEPYGDAEFMLAFREVVYPVLKEFAADLILVSAGFDASEGDPIGGCRVSSECFGEATAGMMECCSSTVLVLEGGYNVAATARGFCACVEALLGERAEGRRGHLSNSPSESAIALMQLAKELYAPKWQSLRE